MKRLLIYIIIYVSGILTLSAQNENNFTKGNDLFSKGKYEEAIKEYQNILNAGLSSASVYYNMGNAYYKLGNLPKSILFYERALLLSPQDKDVRYNLQMANIQITDKLDKVDEFFINRWYNNFKNSFNSDTWAIISIVSFIIVILMIGVFLFTGKRQNKQLSFFLGIFFIIITLFSFNFSKDLRNKLTEHNEAIIFSPTVAVKSSPSDEGKELFILHEGTKVKVIEKLGQWNRVVISDGNEGWLPANSMEII